MIEYRNRYDEQLEVELYLLLRLQIHFVEIDGDASEQRILVIAHLCDYDSREQREHWLIRMKALITIIHE